VKGGEEMYIDPIESRERKEAAFARLYPEVYNKVCGASDKKLPERASLKQDIKNPFEVVVLFKNWLKNLFLKK
jgi:hypothetical protein